MMPNLPPLLELTRQVFAGAVTRAQLARRSTVEQVFVATAIMLVARDAYLEDDNTVKGTYSRLLEDLLSSGVVNNFAGERGFRDGAMLVQAARRIGLYQPARGAGGLKPIVLTPPPQLYALVQRLGRTPAIDAFLRDARAGVEQATRWRQEHVDALAGEDPDYYYRRQIEELVRATAEQFGEQGLRYLKSEIDRRLKR